MLRTGPLPRNDRGDELDSDTAAFLEVLARRGAFDPRQTVGVARRDYDVLGPVLDVARVELARVEDVTIDGGLRARLYVPRETRDLRPGLVWLHGGGFVIGGLRSHDHALRTIAMEAGVNVLAVDYRLGPDHHFPSGHDDALAAFRWTWREAAALGIDRDRMAIGGDSAGGNLAASTSIALRDAREPMPALQVLVYPVTEIGADTASMRTLGEGYFLTKPLMDWFMARYLREKRDEKNPRISVALANLTGLPPAIVSVAGFDPLRDEGEAFAVALAKASVRVERRPEPRMIHGWLTMGGVIPEARRALRGLSAAIRSTLGS